MMTLGSQPWRVLLLSAAFVVLAFMGAFWIIDQERDRQLNDALSADLQVLGKTLRATVLERWSDLDDAALTRLDPTLKADQVTLLLLNPEQHIVWSLGAAPPARTSQRIPLVSQTLVTGTATEEIADWGASNRPHAVVALPIHEAGRLQGVLWLAKPVWSLASDETSLARLLGLAAGLMTLVTIILAIVMFRLRARLFRRLVRGARRLSRGDLHTEIEITGSDELALLSNSLNTVRRRLLAQVEMIDRQRHTLETLVNQLHEGVVVTRDDGRIALINPAATKLLNLDIPEERIVELIGQPVEACIPQHPLQRLLLGPLIDTDHTPVPTEEIASDNPLMRKPVAVEGPDYTVYLLADATTLSLASPDSPDEEIPGRALVLTDVTELQRTIQLRTDFVANASHELRTPLSTIRAAVETLLGMDLREEGPAASNFLQAIDRHSARLQNMVSDLLDLSRLEAPNKQFEPEAISIRGLLDDLHSRFAEVLETKQIHWRTKVEPPELGAINANPHLLRLAIDNLVDNAAKFTEAGGEIRVLVQRDEDASQVNLAVVDTGCGIPPDERTRVFERFYQVERGRSGPDRGTGLGLSIVRHAVGAMKGTVALESAVGTGTRVTISLPLGNSKQARAAG
jgi:two-component system phosphate regulon sensor histidine kinase PhoR